jgi:hypothetical protein
VAIFVALTVAFGTEAPDESVTLPVSVALTTWAIAVEVLLQSPKARSEPIAKNLIFI